MARKYEHLRAKAIELRTQNRMTLTEIMECLGLPKTTVYYWIKDIPIPPREGNPRPRTPAQLDADQRQRDRYAALRDEAYQQGLEEAPELLKDPLFRDFVVAYMCEGTKRRRNEVAFVNSNANMVRLAYRYILQFSQRKIRYGLQYHVDQNPEELKNYWAEQLGIDPEIIKEQRKSNSNQMTGRKWRSIHGLLTVTTGDTYFRARLQGWMDFVENQW